jgi:predicted nucleic acid-binding Zn ribbon protein
LGDWGSIGCFILKTPMETIKNYCPECNEKLRGRTDKKFCSDSCRSMYHNRQKSDQSMVLKMIDKRLKLNRKILMGLYDTLTGDSKMVPLKYVENLGFTFNFYTHIENDTQDEMVFCYEYGYRKVDNQKVQLLKQIPFSEGVDIIA